ncbi:GntR family transcriptional regulator [Caviibacter abscessus]|uniref:GntR family transcriptional regulator n=1 Tax=Caviibacter abscessus TaxID=1766719 RepID=UPI00082FD659|nr:GntR family transcriptional regulator [Caviibacter abscessus]
MEYDKRIPIYIQISDLIVSEILNGYLKAGDPVISVRDASKKYQVNPNTILNAYKELENRGLLYTKRGIGFFVTEEQGQLEELKKYKFEKIVEDFLTTLYNMGYSNNDLTKTLIERGIINE